MIIGQLNCLLVLGELFYFVLDHDVLLFDLFPFDHNFDQVFMIFLSPQRCLIIFYIFSSP